MQHAKECSQRTSLKKKGLWQMTRMPSDGKDFHGLI